MALLRSIFWFALFAASTFCFVVLFEHGVTNFGGNAQKELASVKTMLGMGGKTDKDKDKTVPPGK